MIKGYEKWYQELMDNENEFHTYKSAWQASRKSAIAECLEILQWHNETDTAIDEIKNLLKEE